LWTLRLVERGTQKVDKERGLVTGKVSSQIIEIARTKLSTFDGVYFGEITYMVRFGSVFKVNIVTQELVELKTPREVLERKTKEELVELLVKGSRGSNK